MIHPKTINDYIEQRIYQLDRYICALKQEAKSLQGEAYATHLSLIGDYASRKLELRSLQRNFELGVYKPKETTK